MLLWTAVTTSGHSLVTDISFFDMSKSKPFYWEFIHGRLWLRPQEHIQLTAYTYVMAYSRESISTIRITQIPSKFSCTYESYLNNNTYIYMTNKKHKICLEEVHLLHFLSVQVRRWPYALFIVYWHLPSKSFCRISVECMQVVANRWACARLSTSTRAWYIFWKKRILYLTSLPPSLSPSRWPPWFLIRRGLLDWYLV
jgi:hypothetical protein